MGSELLLLHRVSSLITLARQPSLSSSSTVSSWSRPGWVVTLVLTSSRMEIFSRMSSVLLSSLASSWSLTAGAAASLYYFYTHIAQGEEMFPIAGNSLIAGVWALMCVKWGLALAWAAHQYRLQYREYSLI